MMDILLFRSVEFPDETVQYEVSLGWIRALGRMDGKVLLHGQRVYCACVWFQLSTICGVLFTALTYYGSITLASIPYVRNSGQLLAR